MKHGFGSASDSQLAIRIDRVIQSVGLIGDFSPSEGWDIIKELWTQVVRRLILLFPCTVVPTPKSQEG
jgi:hypothetical protein